MMIGEREGMELGNAIFLYAFAGLLEVFFAFSWKTTDDVCSNRDAVTIWTIKISDFCEDFIELIRKIASIHEFEHLV